LTLVYATLITASERGHGIKMIPAITRQVDNMKKQLFERIPEVKQRVA